MKRTQVGMLLAVVALCAALFAGTAHAAPQRLVTAHGAHGAHATRVAAGVAGCNDVLVEDTGNVKFLEGSGYVILRSALHAWYNPTTSQWCGQAWVNGWFYCWNPSPYACSDFYTGHVEAEIFTTNNGPSSVTNCYFSGNAQGQWYSCNAPAASGTYLAVGGHTVFTTVFDDRYNLSVTTPNFND